MNRPTDEILTFSQEVREIPYKTGSLKRKKNRTADNEERLREVIKMKQYQALFYIEKMESLSK